MRTCTGLRWVCAAVLVLLVALVAPLTITVPSQAAPAGPLRSRDGHRLASHLRADLRAYLRSHGAAEHVSGIGLSVSLAGRRRSVDVSAGTTTMGGSTPVRPDSVWQIGSNTKAFTSVLLLQLEAEHRLSIDDRLGRWLPQYRQWRHVTIRRLLNMTSGIPTYDDEPAWYADYAANPHRYFSPERLVGYVADAPLTSGYTYSNTGYVLAEKIIERVTGRSYRHELYRRIVRPLRLCNLSYRAHTYPARVTRREPAGYLFNEDFPLPQFGQDVSRETLSWARAAGGIISSTRDMTRWERALYEGRLLPRKQQAELESLVSTTTGRPIARTSATDPQGFGLGIAQLTQEGFGTFWFYEGETLGFRALHAYFPESGLIIAVTLNSATAGKNDLSPTLIQSVYETLRSTDVIS